MGAKWHDVLIVIRFSQTEDFHGMERRYSCFLPRAA
jgi:hypothetical protein